MEKKVAVVTGAARGIGKAISKALLQQEMIVVGVDILQNELVETAAALTTDQHTFLPLTADLTQPEKVKEIFAELEKTYGGVDVLVNNAGTCFLTDFVDISPEEFRKQMAINFDSAFYCCQQAIPLMLKRDGIKKIVNISSNGAYNFDVFDPGPLPHKQSGVRHANKASGSPICGRGDRRQLNCTSHDPHRSFRYGYPRCARQSVGRYA